MRSTWLGLSVGILSLIGCNALWQGYLSPLDDPGDASVASSDLTGVPPDDLTGADLTGVDQAGQDLATTPPTPLCGFATVTANVLSYAAYTTVIPSVSGSANNRISVIDTTNDGMTEIAISDGSTSIKEFSITKSANKCTASSVSNCTVANSVLDVEALQISATVGGFIAVTQSNGTAISTCLSYPPTKKDHNNPAFSTNSTQDRRYITVPRMDVMTNGQFIFSEKSGDSTGDRVISLKLDSTPNLSALTIDTIMLNQSSNGSNEPRYASGAHIDPNGADNVLDFVAIEASGGTQRLAAYNNNGTAWQIPKWTLGVASNFDANNDILSAKLSNDNYDDIVTISNGSAQITTYMIGATGIVLGANTTIPSGSNSRYKLSFFDLTGDGIDEMLAVNQTTNAISIFKFDPMTKSFSSAYSLNMRSGYKPVAMALGHLDKSVTTTIPDIFVLAQNIGNNSFEVGVFRVVPTGYSF